MSTISSLSGTASSLMSSLTSSNTSSSSASNTSSSAYNMTPADFIQLMVTQLENQDPTNPTSDSDLMTQMSDIGQLESSSSMQSTLSAVTLQTQVGSASSLIGKTVTGINTNNASVTGVVQSVSIAGSNVNLNLETGDTVAVTNLSSINGTATTSGVAAGNGSSGSTVTGT
jgi:flagellar basal-body rod modification protein FlgD